MKVTAAALLLTLAGAPPGPGPWKTVVEGPPLTIRSRPIPGSRVNESWAEGDMDAPARDLQATLMDPERFPSFMPYVKEARRLPGGAPDGSGYVYTRLELPMVSPRDYVLFIHLDHSIAPDGSGTFQDHWEAAPEKVPERPGTVRLHTNRGGWTIIPKGPNKSHAIYRFAVDPGGLIPSFAADIGNKDAVTGTFRSVEHEAQRRAAERLKHPPPPFDGKDAGR